MTGGPPESGEAMASAQVSEILSQLSAAPEEERKEILESISPILTSAAGRAKYKTYLEQSANLEVIFDCVNASRTNVIATVVVVLNNILDFLDAVVILTKYSRCLQRCLEHPDPEVRRVILHFLRRCSSDSTASTALIGMNDLMRAVLEAVIDGDLGVSKEAKMTVHALAASDDFRDRKLFGVYRDLLVEMSRVNMETLRMRFYDFIVLLAKMNGQVTRQCHDFLKSLCDELTNNPDDFLLQLNVLEVLWDLAETHHGYQYLRDQGVLTHLDSLIHQVSASPYASLLMPGFIKFFGRIAHQCPVDFSDSYPTFTSTLFGLLGSNEMSEDDLKTLALETVGYIASTPAGKQKLEHFGTENVVRLLTRNLSPGSSSKQKITALSTIANILRRGGGNEPADTAVLTENLYRLLDMKLGSNRINFLEMLFDMIKQPFADLCQASYLVLISIGGQEWGLLKMVSLPGFVEYLLDRNTLSSKEAKDMRYRLIQQLHDNPGFKSSGVVQPQMQRKIVQYIKEGPYYVEALVEVALDEGS